MKAKKSYGQHFLVHDRVAESIATLISPQYKNYHILEVGPGRGKLTQFLVKAHKNITVVEADRDMVNYLKEAYANDEISILEADFLKVNLRDTLGNDFILIGNFPYNISTQIIFKMLENRTYIPEMIGMFQKEVADRILASPGNKTYGILSVLTQAYYTGKKAMKLSPGHFNPPPRVDSAVIKLERLDTPRVHSTFSHLHRIVKMAFNQRRKMLRNSLSSLISSEKVKSLPIMRKRPEQLSVEEFDELTLLLNDELCG